MDNADNSDIIKIRRKLEECAKSMIPEIHKYYHPDRDCNNCYYHYKKSKYGNVCNYEDQCKNTIHKPLFEQKDRQSMIIWRD